MKKESPIFGARSCCPLGFCDSRTRLRRNNQQLSLHSQHCGFGYFSFEQVFHTMPGYAIQPSIIWMNSAQSMMRKPSAWKLSLMYQV